MFDALMFDAFTPPLLRLHRPDTRAATARTSFHSRAVSQLLEIETVPALFCVVAFSDGKPDSTHSPRRTSWRLRPPSRAYAEVGVLLKMLWSMIRPSGSALPTAAARPGERARRNDPFSPPHRKLPQNR